MATNLFKAVLFTLLASLLFAAMSALVRYAGTTVPVGQVVFFRAAFAILPVVLIYALRGELVDTLRTRRPLGHAGRGMFSVGGMFLNFASLARLPLVEATAISFTSPLITVAFAGLLLKERVRLYRWSAVIVGFAGVIVMLWQLFDPSYFTGHAGTVAATGAAFALLAAILNSGSVIQTRRLTDSETTSSIVFYFSLICAVAGFLTLPFGWDFSDSKILLALVTTGVLGGLAHILITESYRHAPASVVAPFNYSMMLWAFVLGYLVFGEVPTAPVFVGSAIVAAAGLFVLYRERKLGLKRLEASPPSDA